MQAAFWWIDRWRKSTAHTDMSAEEQGLYRNLLDEIWVRPDGVIPDDARTLANASGDPVAWARCSAKVLRWMRRVPEGWTNDTALEVRRQSTRRAEKQHAYRERLKSAGNGQGNDTGNGDRNKPGSPSPSPSPSLDLDHLKSRASRTGTSVQDRRR